MPYKDRERQLEAQAEHYKQNKDTYNSRRKTSRDYKKHYIEQIKTEKGCLVCGYNKHYAALDIHHINEVEKTYRPAKLHHTSFDYIDNELSNCMVLCRNCHAEHHAGHINANDYAIPITEYKTYQTFDKGRRFSKKDLTSP